MIAGAIFDVDGTLLDTMPIWDQAAARYLRAQGVQPSEDVGAILRPMTMEEGSAWLHAHYLPDCPPAEIGAGVLRLIADFYRYEAQAKPGAPAFLQELARRGVPMALATTSDDALVRSALRRLGLAGRFQALFTCTQLRTSKRQPLIYQTAAAHMGCAPAQTAVFEDVLHALQTARAAGFYTVAVEDAASASDRARIRQTADCYLTDYRQTGNFWRLFPACAEAGDVLFP